MLEAVGRRKAHWLLRAGSEKTFSGKRRPQEDMVTSAVFGSIRLMSSGDRRKAIEVLLGREAFEVSNFADGHDIDAVLWPQLKGLKDRRHVEPDVLLNCADRTTIVEVKWHAPLSERQLERQIEAVGAENVSAVVMLGEAGVGERILDKPCFRRTWRDVSGALQQRRDDLDTPFGRWVLLMRNFLQETDMGRIFNGLPAPRNVENVTYRFEKERYSLRESFMPATVGSVQYLFERKS